MSGAALFLACGPSVLWTISGASIDDTAGVEAGIRFNTDGTTDKLENGSYSQINGSTDWVHTLGGPPIVPTMEIKCEVISGSVTGDPTGTWLSIGASQSREWKCVGPAGAASITISIQNNVGGLKAQGSYTLTAVAP